MTRCSYNVMTQICILRREGNHMKRISEIVGVHRSTIYNWLKKGEKARFGKYRTFYDDWEEARLPHSLSSR